MRPMRTLLLAALLLGASPAAAWAQITDVGAPPLVNETPQAPFLRPAGGALFYSDSPEDVTRAGTTDEAVMTGSFRVFDYHVNDTGRVAWIGAVFTNPHGYPVRLEIRDAARGISGQNGTGLRFVTRWLAARHHPAPRTLTLAPGQVLSQVQRVPAGRVAAELMDLTVTAAGRPASVRVRTVAALSPAAALGVLPILRRQVGLIRAVFPAADATGAWDPGPITRPVAIDLGDVSGPDVGYAAPDRALPGESQEGVDPLDTGTLTPTVWEKGGFARLERLTITAGSPSDPVELLVTTSARTRQGSVHRADPMVVEVRRPYAVVAERGAYLPSAQLVTTLTGAPVTIETTLVPGGSAPICLVLEPTIQGPSSPPASSWPSVMYGWASGGLSASAAVTLELPPVARMPGTLLVTPAGGGVAAEESVLVVTALGPHPITQVFVGPQAQTTMRVAVPSPPTAIQLISAAPGAYWVDWLGRRTLVVFADDPLGSTLMGPPGGSVRQGGVAVWVAAGTLTAPARVSVSLHPLPALPGGLEGLTPLIQVKGPPHATLHGPILLDLDDMAVVDRASARGQTLVLLRWHGHRWTRVPTGDGATWLANGNERSYPVPAFGEYAMARVRK